MNKQEAKVDTKVLEWFAKNYPYSVAVEVKIKGNKVKPHQALALKEVQDGAFQYKIPDLGRKNPFDGFVLKGAHAFVVTVDEHKCTAVRIDDYDTFKFRV